MSNINVAGAVDLSKHSKDAQIIRALAADRDTMRLQRNMLGQALGELLVALGVMQPTDVNGPTLISVAHAAIGMLTSGLPEFNRIDGRDPDRTTGYAPVDPELGESVIPMETLTADPEPDQVIPEASDAND